MRFRSHVFKVVPYSLFCELHCCRRHTAAVLPLNTPTPHTHPHRNSNPNTHTHTPQQRAASPGPQPTAAHRRHLTALRREQTALNAAVVQTPRRPHGAIQPRIALHTLSVVEDRGQKLEDFLIINTQDFGCVSRRALGAFIGHFHLFGVFLTL